MPESGNDLRSTGSRSEGDVGNEAQRTPAPNVRWPVIAVDVYHGRVPPGASEFLQQRSFLLANPFEIRLVNHVLTADSLAATHILAVASLGHTNETTFSGQEATTIEQFVADGGGLLCAGQAWSWVYPSYGNKPVETFPLNVLGKRLGFWITGTNIGSPVPCRSDITSGVQVMARKGWWPSEIKLSSDEYMPFIQDGEGHVMAVHGSHKKGRVVVVGHEAMFDGNPQVLLNALRFLLPRFALPQIKPAPSSSAGTGTTP